MFGLDHTLTFCLDIGTGCLPRFYSSCMAPLHRRLCFPDRRYGVGWCRENMALRIPLETATGALPNRTDFEHLKQMSPTHRLKDGHMCQCAM
jgi:hypothetical protein